MANFEDFLTGKEKGVDGILERIIPTIRTCLQSASEFKTGQDVPRSGIYIVTHDNNHAEEHEVTCVKDKIFPPCSGCDGNPTFKLLLPAKHVSEHEFFKPRAS